MDNVQALILALVQGLTEFLPISSSAHLILPARMFGWPDQGLAFDVAVHLGTLLAVVAYYRRDLWAMTRGAGDGVMQRRMNPDLRLGLLVVLATVPAVAAGFLAKDLIENELRSAAVIAVTTVVFGVLLWLADVYGARKRAVAELGVGSAGALRESVSTSRWLWKSRASMIFSRSSYEFPQVVRIRPSNSSLMPAKANKKKHKF